MARTWDDATAEAMDALVREFCEALPEVQERLSHGAPSYFVRGKKMFVALHDDHHGDGRLGVWCAAPPGVQAVLLETEPDRFYKPAYVAQHGWIGLDLTKDFDRDELEAIIEEAYRQVAPKTLIKQLDASA